MRCGKLSSFSHSYLLFWGHVRGQFGYLQSARQAALAYISSCICLRNFVQIRPSATEWWRYILLPRRRPRHRNSTSGLGFRDCSDGKVDIYLHRKISAWYLNHQPRYYYFRFVKTNVHEAGILLPVPIFMLASPSACHSASAYQTSSKSDHQRQSYHVISISQDGDYGITILLLVSVCRDFAHLGRSKSTRIQNFGEISQFTAEILLLPVIEKKRSPCWNSYFRFRFLPRDAMLARY